jgi:hypothetical protein
MMTAIKRTILAILLCLPSLGLPSLAQSQTQQSGPGADLRVLFIHCGPKTADDPAVRKIAVKLASSGYSVREPEEDQDKVGGPGVDYFAPNAAGDAQKIADLVNELLAPGPDRQLKPRLQSAKNPSNYFGVWLY